MKSFLAIALLLGAAAANSTSYYGWAPNQEIRYRFRSETVTGMPSVKQTQYAGFRLESDVIVQTFQDYTLRIRFVNPKYVVANEEMLPVVHGWPQLPQATRELPGDFKTKLTAPFEAQLRRGVIETVKVGSDEPVEVTNVKKALLSQLQMDVTGSGRGYLAEQNFLNGGNPQTVQPLNGEQQSYFSTLESTLEGECQTDYTFVPIPKFQTFELNMDKKIKEQQEGVWSDRRSSQIGDQVCQGKQYYEIVKSINLDNCVQRPVFAIQTGIENSCDVSKGHCKDIFANTVNTRYIVCGQRDQFIIRQVSTEGEMVATPLGWDNTPEKMRQRTRVQLAIVDYKQSGVQPMPQPGNAEQKQNLAFEYPTGHNQRIRQQSAPTSGATINPGNTSYIHPIRHFPDMQSESNILPQTVQFNDLQNQVQQNFQEIVRIFFNGPESSCSGKFDVSGRLSTIAKMLRPLSLNQLRQIERQIESAQYPNQQQKQLALHLFYDVVAMAGSNPAFLIIKDALVHRQSVVPLSNRVRLVQSVMRSTFTPTQQLFQEMLSLVQQLQNQQQGEEKTVYYSAVIGLSNLVYKACVNPKTRISSFPVRIYGHFCNENSQFISEQYVPYLTQQLQQNDHQEDVKMVLISALGKTGHKKALLPLTQIIEYASMSGSGSRTVQPEHDKPVLRSLAVNSLRRLARREPTLVRRILLSIMENPAETPEVRIAAIGLLPYARPSVADLQRLAVRTWHEPNSKQVSCFAASTLRSLSSTIVPDLKTEAEKAKTVIKMVKPSQCGLSYSQNILVDTLLKYAKIGVAGTLTYVNGEDNFLPTMFTAGHKAFGSNWMVDGLVLTSYSQGLENVFDKIVMRLGGKSQVNSESKQKLDDIKRQLNAKVQEYLQPQAMLMTKMADYELLLPINKQKYDEIIAKVVDSLTGNMLGGSWNININNAGVNTHLNIEAYGPSIAGFPVYVSRTAPIVHGMRAQLQKNGQIGNQMEMTGSIKPLINTKTEAVAGIYLPFNTEFVGAGVEFSFHFFTPLTGRVTLSQTKLDLAIRPCQNVNGDAELMHYFVKPYTVRKNCQKVDPFSKADDVKTILSGSQPKNEDFPILPGQGIKAEMKIETDVKHFDLAAFVNMLRQHNVASLTSFIGYLATPSCRYNSIALHFNPSESSIKEIETTFGYTMGQKFSGSQPELVDLEGKSETEKLQTIQQSCQRRHQLSYEIEKCIEKEQSKEQHKKQTAETLKSMLSEMQSGSHGWAKGLSVETALVGGSATDRTSVKSKIVLGSEESNYGTKYFFDISLQAPQGGEVFVKYQGQANVPVVPYRWNIDQIIRNNVNMQYNGKVLYGLRNAGQPSELISFTTQYSKNQKLVQEIQNSPEYAACQQEIAAGRHLASVCEELRHQGSSINQLQMNAQLQPMVINSSFGKAMKNLALSFLVPQFYYAQNGQLNGQNTLAIQAQVNRVGDEANMTISLPSMQTMKINHIRIPQILRNVVPFSLRDPVGMRLLQTLTRDQLPASCRISGQQIYTFDNKTYHYAQDNCKHLLYKDCSGRQTEKQVAITAERGVGRYTNVEMIVGQNQIKIQYGHAQRIGQMVVPYVNGQEVHLNHGTPYIKRNGSGNVQLVLYRFQDGVVMAFAPQEYTGIFYDGSKIELVAPQMLSKNRACGLCGDNNGEYNTDLKTPQQCIMSQPRFAAYSYILNSGSGQQCQIPAEDQQQYQREIQECVQKIYQKTPVAQLARQQYSTLQQGPGSLARNGQAHLVEQTPNQICLSKQPLQTCLPGTQPKQSVPVDVQMVCLPRNSDVAQVMARRAEEGDIIGELQSMGASLTQRVNVPVKCSGRFPYNTIIPSGSGQGPYPHQSYRTSPRGY